MHMLKISPTGQIDIQDVADVLNVKIRRMYDVTNVLEGCNMIKKIAPRKYGWKTGNIDDLQIIKDYEK